MERTKEDYENDVEICVSFYMYLPHIKICVKKNLKSVCILKNGNTVKIYDQRYSRFGLVRFVM